MFERLTDRGRRVMAFARKAAQRLGHEHIGSEHILLGLLEEGGGVAAKVLEGLEVDFDEVRRQVEQLTPAGSADELRSPLDLTPRAKQVLQWSREESGNLGHDYVGTEHLLLGLLRTQQSTAAQVLQNSRLELDGVRAAVVDFLVDETMRRSTPPS